MVRQLPPVRYQKSDASATSRFDLIRKRRRNNNNYNFYRSPKPNTPHENPTQKHNSQQEDADINKTLRRIVSIEDEIYPGNLDNDD